MRQINWHRCTFEERDDGIYFCEGLHERSAACEWEKLTVEHIKSIAYASVSTSPSPPVSGAADGRGRITMELFYFESSFGCGIRSAKNEDAAWNTIERAIGSENLSLVRPATDDDIAWVRGMGGYIPKLPAHPTATQPT